VSVQDNDQYNDQTVVRCVSMLFHRYYTCSARLDFF